MKKNFFRSAFVVAAFAAVGLGSYKTYGSYVANNAIQDNALFEENIEAYAEWWDPLIGLGIDLLKGLFGETEYKYNAWIETGESKDVPRYDAKGNKYWERQYKYECQERTSEENKDDQCELGSIKWA